METWRRLSWLVAALVVVFGGPHPVTGSFLCTFEHNQTCGYRSQENMLPFESVDEVDSLSAFGVMRLDLSRVNLSMARGARLYGHYYPTFQMKTVCPSDRVRTRPLIQSHSKACLV